MLVMKALRQDVAVLAFHPPLRTPGTQGSWDSTIVRPTEDLLLFPQMFSVGRVIAVPGVAAFRSNQQGSVTYLVIRLVGNENLPQQMEYTRLLGEMGPR